MAKDSAPSPQPAILGFLILTPRHPYELHQEFERELGPVWHVGQSHLYTHLKQLLDSGLVTVSIEAQTNRPNRTIYHITPKGREVFFQWLHQPSQHVRLIRLEFLTRLYFFQRLDIPGLEQLVIVQKTLLQGRIASLEQVMADTNNKYLKLVLEFRKSEMSAIVSWLDRCLKDFMA
ncbi:MAG: PadR family transcriptional regulator [Anaerolineae bacterium]|nr:PadR family transcriptional regulator [Anaerolineae bacterium]